MSYAMNGLGAFENCQQWSGAERCLGYERSCPDHEQCCAPDSWYNAVYAQLKGDSSLRRQNEEKVRHAMALLLAPTSSGRTGIEQAAYDRNQAVPTGLIDKVATAATTFELAFPRERFVYKADRKKAPQHPPPTWVCQDDGYYSGYSVQAYWPKARVQAVQALTGYVFNSAQAQQLAQSGLAAEGEFPQAGFLGSAGGPLEAPPAVAEVFEKVSAVISMAPGCRPDQYRDAMPQLGDLVATVGRGTLGPTDWLQSFIVALTPKLSLASQFPNLVGKMPPNMRHPGVPPTELNEEGSPSQSRVPPTTGSRPMGTAAKVGVAVVGLGVGYAIFRAVT